MKEEPAQYKEMSYEEKRKIDQKAYKLYYKKFMTIDDSIEFEDWVMGKASPPQTEMSFNEFFGSEEHEKYVNLLLRKQKLKKIKKKFQP
jgi:hypothetical protein